MPWYKTGTVTITNGANFITGVGTNFTANVRVGDALRGPDGAWYEVLNVTSSTVLGIFPNYAGVSVTGSSNFMITPVQGYNKDSADRLRAITDSLTVVTSVAGRTGNVVLSKSDVGLASVDNTADTAKPVSTAQQTALNLKIDKSSIVDNLTTDDATKVLSAKQGKTLSDTVTTNRSIMYTKTEVDSLLVTSVGQGYIEGLQLIWNSGTSISIGAGSAYVGTAAKRVFYAGGTITPITVQVVNTFVHIYLSSTGTILQSLTGPERYYNTAWRLTGDANYRYIGSILVNTNASGAYKFRHSPLDGYVAYTHGDPQTVPFLLISGTSTSMSFNARTSAPVTAHTMEGAYQNTATSGSVRFTPSDAGTSAATGWFIFVLPSALITGRCPIASDGTITVNLTSPAAASCYLTGYYFQR